MGPIDYVVIEFPHRRVAGEGLPVFLDLVDHGIVRVLDLAFICKESDGSVHRVQPTELSPRLAPFEGAASGLLDQDDIDSAAGTIDPDSGAALLVYENRWAAEFVTKLRQGGAQLVAYGHLPVQGILAALDAADSAQSASTSN